VVEKLTHSFGTFERKLCNGCQLSLGIGLMEDLAMCVVLGRDARSLIFDA